MSVRVAIDLNERNLKEIESNWIVEQVGRRRDANVPACVRVFINYDDIELVLGTGDCNFSKGKGRVMTESENKIVQLWDRYSLSKRGFTPNNLINFLKQLKA